MLLHTFQRSLRAAEKDDLRREIYVLLAEAEPTDTAIDLPPVMRESRYNSVNSGLVAWVVDAKNNMLWRSSSGELIAKEEMPVVDTEFRSGRERFFTFYIDDEEYYAISYDTTWDIFDSLRGYRFIVMQSRAPMYNELKAYRVRLRNWLGGLAILLILVQTIVARWGLSPLRRLASDLEKIESGDQSQLPGNYPADIQPVTDNLNAVLNSERTQRERYRNTLSDLAHSLKTPLAVIRGQLENTNDTDLKNLRSVVDEQITRMSAIVDHQLRRASAQVTQASHSAVPLRPIVERLKQAMLKVYAYKNLHFEVKIDGNLSFHGDEADLMELIGNLIDNACKYGKGHVLVSAKRAGPDLELRIEDNGPGVAEDVRETILTRGTRADSATPGQGIGLAVAVDVLSSYGGSVQIVKSSLGGACFILSIPD